MACINRHIDLKFDTELRFMCTTTMEQVVMLGVADGLVAVLPSHPAFR